jgi:hypothetical protein
MLGIYQSQIEITVQRDRLTFLYRPSQASSKPSKPITVPLSPGIIDNCEILDREAFSDVLRRHVRRLNSKNLFCKIVFVLESLPVMNRDITVPEGSTLNACIQKTLQDEGRLVEGQVAYQSLPYRSNQLAQRFKLFVTRTDILESYRFVLDMLSDRVAVVEFRTNCFIPFIHEVLRHDASTFKIFNVAGGRIQTAFVKDNHISYFEEITVSAAKAGAPSDDDIMNAIAEFDRSVSNKSGPGPVELILINKENGTLGDRLLQNYLGAKIITVDPLKSFLFKRNPPSYLEAPVSGAPLLEEPSGEKPQLKSSPVQALARLLKFHSKDEKRSEDQRGKKESQSSSSRLKLVGLGLAAAVALMLLYLPDESGIKVLTQEATDNPYMKVGLPIASPEQYKQILAHLESEKLASESRGAAMPAYQEMQLEFLRKEQANKVF